VTDWLVRLTSTNEAQVVAILILEGSNPTAHAQFEEYPHSHFYSSRNRGMMGRWGLSPFPNKAGAKTSSNNSRQTFLYSRKKLV